MRLTTEKGSMLYEPVKPDLYVVQWRGLSNSFYRCEKDEADGVVLDIRLFDE